MRPTIEELLDRAEIQDLLNRYTFQHDVLAVRLANGTADGTEFDVFDEIFTPDAVLDFTHAFGSRRDLSTTKTWMAEGNALFPVQEHLMGQTEFEFSADRNEAKTRTWMINPMGFRQSDGTIHVFVMGGFYHDNLIRTSNGWRIRERACELTWQFGETPAELKLPPPELDIDRGLVRTS
jgi:hypothetical protein